MLGSLVFMLVVEVVALPIFALLFNLNVITLPIICILCWPHWDLLPRDLFRPWRSRPKAASWFYPFLFLPHYCPVIIAAVKASAIALSGGAWSAMAGWLLVIAAFDAVFIVVSLWVFNFVIERVGGET